MPQQKECKECHSTFASSKGKKYCSAACQKEGRKTLNTKAQSRIRTQRADRDIQRKKQKISDLSELGQAFLMNATALNSPEDKEVRVKIAESFYMKNEEEISTYSLWDEMKEHTGSGHPSHPTGIPWLGNRDYCVLEDVISTDHCTELLEQINLWDNARSTRSRETDWVVVLENASGQQAGRYYYNQPFPDNLYQPIDVNFIQPVLLGYPCHESWYVRAMKSHPTTETPCVQQGK
jgi:hypothetical protein